MVSKKIAWFGGKNLQYFGTQVSEVKFVKGIIKKTHRIMQQQGRTGFFFFCRAQDYFFSFTVYAYISQTTPEEEVNVCIHKILIETKRQFPNTNSKECN